METYVHTRRYGPAPRVSALSSGACFHRTAEFPSAARLDEFAALGGRSCQRKVNDTKVECREALVIVHPICLGAGCRSERAETCACSLRPGRMTGDIDNSLNDADVDNNSFDAARGIWRADMDQTLDQVPVGSAESAKTPETPCPCAPPLDTSSAMQRASTEKPVHGLAALEDGLVVVSLAATPVDRSGSVKADTGILNRRCVVLWPHRWRGGPHGRHVPGNQRSCAGDPAWRADERCHGTYRSPAIRTVLIGAVSGEVFQAEAV